MRFKALVLVTPKPGISDPEGATIEDAARHLGFANVSRVTAGRAFVVEGESGGIAEARAEIDTMGERLLSNPVIQEYSVLELEEI